MLTNGWTNDEGKEELRINIRYGRDPAPALMENAISKLIYSYDRY
jgi:hypothetical protein